MSYTNRASSSRSTMCYSWRRTRGGATVRGSRPLAVAWTGRRALLCCTWSRSSCA
ncbi:hypothetical protein PVAP13_1KG353700 [Panicum virgatum]|uniref:Uncharacterized protein n=1 Tax=Panicum virgatum TaxID=38727 RepID=A0A8T0XQG0_PANVG|nr:hypothetical protein PVAP13_1KG353700 [Panicum virgatum]